MPVQNELKFHYTVHTSLDVVEEKISAVGKSIGDQRELYLGLLYPTEDYKVHPLNKLVGFCKILFRVYIVNLIFSSFEFDLKYAEPFNCSKHVLHILNCSTRYGYVTNTKVKFVIVVDSSNTSLRDNEIRSVSWSQIELLQPFSFGINTPGPCSMCALVIFRCSENCTTLSLM